VWARSGWACEAGRKTIARGYAGKHAAVSLTNTSRSARETCGGSRFGVRRLAAAFVPAHGRVPIGRDESSVPSALDGRTLLAFRTKSGGKPPHSKACYARKAQSWASQNCAALKVPNSSACYRTCFGHGAIAIDGFSTQTISATSDTVTPAVIEELLKREIDVGSFPGAAWAVGTVEGIASEGAVGHAVAVPLRIPASTETIWDCASITKPLITTTLILQAIAERTISLDDEFRGFSYRELLTHTSGLKAWLPLYAFDDYLETIEREGREQPRGSGVIYSDLNFVLLYYALREIHGDFVTAARERIFEPLGLRDSWFNPQATLRPRIAATEWGQRFEQGMCASRSVVFTGFRAGLMWGEANDGNSFYAGGTCGNAGLFATASDVFRIAQVFVSGELVPLDLVREATRTHAGDRGLGWQTGGPELSSDSFGHTGFTGTSVWVDGGRIMVLLTNRVHPVAAAIAMQRIRGEFHRISR
jgi:serine-type D-Ala-D-Ala carboxypeptidase